MPDKFTYTEAELQELLDGIMAGTISEYAIPGSLYLKIADYLKSGLYSGFGGTLADFSGVDLELLTELRENVYMFSAAKSYQELKEIGSLMFDESGNLRSNREFNKLAAQTFETWNESWGLTERNTAEGQAQMASKWNEIERNKDLLPILIYDARGDACVICKPLDGLTAPVSDPIWRTKSPLNHFNCFCVLTQHEEGESKLTPEKEVRRIDKEVDAKMDNIFKMNPGIDRYVFSPDHPYFQVEPKDRAYAANNFNLPIPKNDEPIKGKQTETNGVKNIKDAKQKIKDVISLNSGLNIDRVTIPTDMSIDMINKKVNAIESLFNEYKVNPIIDKSYTTNISLKSTTKLNGYVKYEYKSSTNKAWISTVNFGDKTIRKSDVLFDPLATRVRTFSRVDEKNLDISTITHEFGHIMSIDLSSYVKNQPEWYNEFNRELRQIRTNYRSEMLVLNKAKNFKAINELSLGQYSGTNIDEFLAEAFTEYKLSSNPSKYATQVGKLIDKNFKK